MYMYNARLQINVSISPKINRPISSPMANFRSQRSRHWPLSIRGMEDAKLKENFSWRTHARNGLSYSIIVSFRPIFLRLATISFALYNQYKNRFKNFKSSFVVKLFEIIDRGLIKKKNLKSIREDFDSKNRPFESENIK